MTPSDVRVILIKAVDDWVLVADRPALAKRLADPDEDVRFDELDVDSLAAAEISIAIEDQTGYACDLADFLTYPSIRSLSDHIAAQLAEART